MQLYSSTRTFSKPLSVPPTSPISQSTTKTLPFTSHIISRPRSASSSPADRTSSIFATHFKDSTNPSYSVSNNVTRVAAIKRSLSGDRVSSFSGSATKLAVNCPSVPLQSSTTLKRPSSLPLKIPYASDSGTFSRSSRSHCKSFSISPSSCSPVVSSRFISASASTSTNDRRKKQYFSTYYISDTNLHNLSIASASTTISSTSYLAANLRCDSTLSSSTPDMRYIDNSFPYFRKHSLECNASLMQTTAKPHINLCLATNSCYAVATQSFATNLVDSKDYEHRMNATKVAFSAENNFKDDPSLLGNNIYYGNCNPSNGSVYNVHCISASQPFTRHSDSKVQDRFHKLSNSESQSLMCNYTDQAGVIKFVKSRCLHLGTYGYCVPMFPENSESHKEMETIHRLIPDRNCTVVHFKRELAVRDQNISTSLRKSFPLVRPSLQLHCNEFEQFSTFPENYDIPLMSNHKVKYVHAPQYQESSCIQSQSNNFIIEKLPQSHALCSAPNVDHGYHLKTRDKLIHTGHKFASELKSSTTGGQADKLYDKRTNVTAKRNVETVADFWNVNLRSASSGIANDTEQEEHPLKFICDDSLHCQDLASKYHTSIKRENNCYINRNLSSNATSNYEVYDTADSEWHCKSIYSSSSSEIMNHMVVVDSSELLATQSKSKQGRLMWNGRQHSIYV